MLILIGVLEHETTTVANKKVSARHPVSAFLEIIIGLSYVVGQCVQRFKGGIATTSAMLSVIDKAAITVGVVAIGNALTVKVGIALDVVRYAVIVIESIR